MNESKQTKYIWYFLFSVYFLSLALALCVSYVAGKNGCHWPKQANVSHCGSVRQLPHRRDEVLEFAAAKIATHTHTHIWQLAKTVCGTGQVNLWHKNKSFNWLKTKRNHYAEY